MSSAMTTLDEEKCKVPNSSLGESIDAETQQNILLKRIEQLQDINNELRSKLEGEGWNAHVLQWIKSVPMVHASSTPLPPSIVPSVHYDEILQGKLHEDQERMEKLHEALETLTHTTLPELKAEVLAKEVAIQKLEAALSVAKMSEMTLRRDLEAAHAQVEEMTCRLASCTHELKYIRTDVEADSRAAAALREETCAVLEEERQKHTLRELQLSGEIAHLKHLLAQEIASHQASVSNLNIQKYLSQLEEVQSEHARLQRVVEEERRKIEEKDREIQNLNSALELYYMTEGERGTYSDSFMVTSGSLSSPLGKSPLLSRQRGVDSHGAEIPSDATEPDKKKTLTSEPNPSSLDTTEKWSSIPGPPNSVSSTTGGGTYPLFTPTLARFQRKGLNPGDLIRFWFEGHHELQVLHRQRDDAIRNTEETKRALDDVATRMERVDKTRATFLEMHSPTRFRQARSELEVLSAELTKKDALIVELQTEIEVLHRTFPQESLPSPTALPVENKQTTETPNDGHVAEPGEREAVTPVECVSAIPPLPLLEKLLSEIVQKKKIVTELDQEVRDLTQRRSDVQSALHLGRQRLRKLHNFTVRSAGLHESLHELMYIEGLEILQQGSDSLCAFTDGSEDTHSNRLGNLMDSEEKDTDSSKVRKRARSPSVGDPIESFTETLEGEKMPAPKDVPVISATSIMSELGFTAGTTGVSQNDSRELKSRLYRLFDRWLKERDVLNQELSVARSVAQTHETENRILKNQLENIGQQHQMELDANTTLTERLKREKDCLERRHTQCLERINQQERLLHDSQMVQRSLVELMQTWKERLVGLWELQAFLNRKGMHIFCTGTVAAFESSMQAAMHPTYLKAIVDAFESIARYTMEIRAKYQHCGKDDGEVLQSKSSTSYTHAWYEMLRKEKECLARQLEEKQEECLQKETWATLRAVEIEAYREEVSQLRKTLERMGLRVHHCASQSSGVMTEGDADVLRTFLGNAYTLVVGDSSNEEKTSRAECTGALSTDLHAVLTEISSFFRELETQVGSSVPGLPNPPSLAKGSLLPLPAILTSTAEAGPSGVGA